MKPYSKTETERLLKEWSDRYGQSTDALTVELVTQLTDCEAERTALEIGLNAWYKTFGTTQLTHALARLEVAERKADRYDDERAAERMKAERG
jgi:hypothetical protein